MGTGEAPVFAGQGDGPGGTFANDTVRTIKLRRDPAPLQSLERDSVAERADGHVARNLPSMPVAVILLLYRGGSAPPRGGVGCPQT